MPKRTKINLREFQSGLAERLKQAATGTQENTYLGVHSGQDYWLLPLDEAGEVIPLADLTEIPMTRPWFAGLTNIRGNLYSVVDFAAFRGQEKTRVTPQNRLILFNQRLQLPTGLLVDRILGIKRLSGFTDASLASPTTSWIKANWQENETGRMWKELSLVSLGQDPNFLQIDQPIQ